MVAGRLMMVDGRFMMVDGRLMMVVGRLMIVKRKEVNGVTLKLFEVDANIKMVVFHCVVMDERLSVEERKKKKSLGMEEAKG